MSSFSSNSDEGCLVNSNNDDDTQEVSSNRETPFHISSLSTHPENILKKEQTILDQPVDPSIASGLDEGSRNALSSDQRSNNVVIRPQKPSALVIQNVMSPLPPGNYKINMRRSAPHLEKIQSQEEDSTTGVPRRIPRNVGNVQEEPRPWWKKNIRKEKEDRARKEKEEAEKAFVFQKESKRKFNFGEENEKGLRRRKLIMPPEFDPRPLEILKSEGQAGDQRGEEWFLFPLSKSEGEDDLQTLKFLCAYISNGAHLVPRFRRLMVDFINGVLAENCRIKFALFWDKVVVLHRKFQRLVQLNGGENFREIDFSRACDYEMAELCRLIWSDRKEGKRSGSCSDPDTDEKMRIEKEARAQMPQKPTPWWKKNIRKEKEERARMALPGQRSSVNNKVQEADKAFVFQEMKVDHGNAAGLAVNVDPGIESSDQGMNVDGGNASGLVVNVDQGDGADREVTLVKGYEAGTEQGVTMDHGNEATREA
ncbi:hypothetical protein DCAR_0831076 [Daucus carota subsp. sativus]|uniref:Uncharacterized protein n=1 Tax=Daucus carota subsp. sativus TaxID=79200 RepID=A0A175YM58_DAUCS|nr:hypothetical protein DCAR_0831076 [Daucus carota subsp. sativus]